VDSSRRDLLIYMAEHRSILENDQVMFHRGLFSHPKQARGPKTRASNLLFSFSHLKQVISPKTRANSCLTCMSYIVRHTHLAC